MWVPTGKKAATEDYHNNINHKVFIHWFEHKLCKNLAQPSIIILNNTGYHKNKDILAKEKTIFNGWTFSNLHKGQLQVYLSHHKIAWEKSWTVAQLKEVAKPKYNTAPPLLKQITAQYGHKILFLPPYHSNHNPIENMWGHVKGYVARNQTKFTMDEVKRLVKEGIAKTTPEMWRNAIWKVNEMEEEMYVNDVDDELH
jgi:transposase